MQSVLAGKNKNIQHQLTVKVAAIDSRGAQIGLSLRFSCLL
jgi:hypothetical protein